MYKPIAIALAAIVVSLSAVACGSETTTTTPEKTIGGEHPWSVQYSGSSASLTDVAFSDATHGWAVGYDDSKTGAGVILATTNGGAPR